MNQQSTETSQRAALLQAYRVIKELKAELKATKDSQTPEPIAIIGLGCRFPQAPDPESFWQLLQAGGDATREVPAERWDINAYYDPDPNTQGKMYTRRAAFLDEIDQFDPHFFRLSPREAVSMDPQQRLLLEVSWEAIENAGIAADKLENSNTGVYIGQARIHSEYALLDPTRIQFDHYIGTGNDSSVPAGRLSYFFGLKGPCMVVSTACSSSLVATHLAIQALRHGECDLALAGGVQLNLSPEPFILLSKTNALAPDGYCKTFDATADGYSRGEGCGIIVLKRLSDALANGDSIRAIIRGTAINHDGSSAGLTVPDGTAQKNLLRQAIADANIEPAQISYIEAHGTGTSLGDPIEIQAIGQIMGQRETPLFVGSVKTNIGHLENSAGVASIIKVVLSMEQGEIPANLHFNQPNPHIPWSALPIQVVTERTPWQVERRIAGVSSFGFSGTNAHIILEAPTASKDKAQNLADNETHRTEPSRLCHLLPLSAKTPEALTALAAQYAAHLASAPELELTDVCYTAGAGRTHFNHRLSLIAGTVAEARTQLASVAAGQETTNVIQAIIGENTVPKIAFLFTGQGSQYIDMGRELYEREPLFRKTLEQCDEILRPYLAQPLLSVIFAADSSSTLLHETAYTQPVLFALEYALAQVWKSWGIEPDIVMGHSVGEYVAACVAGVFTLEEGLKLIAERGRLMQAQPTGDMYAILADEQCVATAIRPYAQQVSIAAINGPQSVNISGEPSAIQTIVTHLQAEGVKVKKLTVSHAFHSPLMASMVADFERVAKEVTYSPPKIDLVSNVTGELITDQVATPAYWCHHILAPVRFLEGMNTLHQEAVDIFVEIGPKPTLIGMGLVCVPDEYGTWLPTLRPGQSDQQQMLTSLGALYVQGAEVNWKGVVPHGRKVALPTYPFQRQRYWLSDSRATPQPIIYSLKPLIDKMIQSPLLKETLFETEFSTETLPFLADHLVYGEVVVPAACHLSLLLNAVTLAFGEPAYQIEDVIFPSALVISKNETCTVQLILTPTTSGTSFQLISFKNAQAKPVTNAMGRITTMQDVPSGSKERTVSIEALQKRCSVEIESETLYEAVQARRIELGPTFRWLAGLWRGENETLGLLQLPNTVARVADYQLHPGLIDTCFQLTGTSFSSAETETYLPFSIESLHYYSSSNSDAWWGITSQKGTHKWDIQLLEPTGKIIAEVIGFEVRQAPQDSVLTATNTWRDWLYQVEWQPQALEKSQAVATHRHWLIFADDSCNGSIGVELAAQLRARGDMPVVVFAGPRYEQVNDQTYKIDPNKSEEYHRLFKEQSNVDGVVYLWNIHESMVNLPADESILSKRMYERILHLLQTLIVVGVASLWLVTRDAQAINKYDTMTGLVQSPLWGLGRVIVQEHPELVCTMFDINADDANTSQLTEALLAEMTASHQKREDWIAFRNGQRYVARLVHHSYPEQLATLPTIRPDSTYLITGGLGGLGLLTAHWLVTQGAKHLILMGRSEPNEEAKQQLKAFAEAGTQVIVVQADVANTKQVAQVLDEVDEKWPLRGIIHAAGVLDDGILLQQNWARFAKVLAPKMQGAWNLHILTQTISLDFFLLFSSSTVLLGNAGQCNYAVANGFLDALAHYRRHQGLPGLSINWGAWSEVGMAAKLGIAKQTEKEGLGSITPQLGLEVMSALMTEEVAQVLVTPMDWSKWLLRLHKVPAFFEEMMPKMSEAIQDTVQNQFLQQFKNTPIEQQRVLLVEQVRHAVGTVLGTGGKGYSTELLGLQQNFFDYGMDSLTSIELRNLLQTLFGCSLPATLIFNHPSIEAIVDYLMQEILRQSHSQSTLLGARSASTVNAIQPHGSKLPLFFVSGAAGPVFNLYPLAYALGTEQPFFGLQAPGIDDETALYTRTEDIAAHHIKDLLAIKPKGPYLLGGYSFGGKVAFEMAQQLQSQQHEVPLIAIIDIPPAPSSVQFVASSVGDSTYITEIAALLELTHKNKLMVSEQVLHSLSPNEQMDYFFECLRNAQVRISKNELQRILNLYKANVQAELEYVPSQSVSAPILLFQATEIHSSIVPAIRLNDPTWGWSHFSSEVVETYVIPGDHYTMMMEPNVQILAERLQARLEQVHIKKA